MSWGGSRPLGLGWTKWASHHKWKQQHQQLQRFEHFKMLYSCGVLTLLREGCSRRVIISNWPFPRTSLHVQVSVKVTSILRYSVTSLLSCRMSGWEAQRTHQVTLMGSMKVQCSISFTPNVKLLTFNFFRCWQQTHNTSLICLIQGMVRSLESAKDTYQTWKVKANSHSYTEVPVKHWWIKLRFRACSLWVRSQHPCWSESLGRASRSAAEWEQNKDNIAVFRIRSTFPRRFHVPLTGQENVSRKLARKKSISMHLNSRWR